MNMERKYIEKVLEDMKERLEYVQAVKESSEQSEKEYDEKEHEVYSFSLGLHKGCIFAYKNEIEFLKREIKFLSRLLEIN